MAFYPDVGGRETKVLHAVRSFSDSTAAENDLLSLLNQQLNLSSTDDDNVFAIEDVVGEQRIEETCTFIECPSALRELYDRIPFGDWIVEGTPVKTMDDQTQFCEAEYVKKIVTMKEGMIEFTETQIEEARARANPYEAVKKVFFQSREALKIANMDRILNWRITREFDDEKRRMKVFKGTGDPPVNPSRDDELYRFADICGGPGGHSEYLLWRKGFYNATGVGLTLRAYCDFKPQLFLAGSFCYLQPFYGPNKEGDIYQPETLQAYGDFVQKWSNGKGVDFATCDGSVSVMGVETLQEVCHHRLFLCECIAALSAVKLESGCLLFKFFTTITPFTVAIIYCLYLAFERITIHKPVTVRPGNSEKFVFCENLTKFGATKIRDYLFKVNERLAEIEKANETHKRTVLEFWPLHFMKADTNFYNYIREHNKNVFLKQLLYMRIYRRCLHDKTFVTPGQNSIRQRVLEHFEIPDISRLELTRLASGPDKKLAEWNKQFLWKYTSQTDALVVQNYFRPLAPCHLLHEEFFVQHVPASSLAVLMLVDNDHTIFARLLGARGAVFRTWYHGTRNPFPSLPPDTIVLVERRADVFAPLKDRQSLHIIDAAVLAGDDVSGLPLNKRLAAARKFAAAVNARCPTPMPVTVGRAVKLDSKAMEPLFHAPVTGWMRVTRAFHPTVVRCIDERKQRYWVKLRNPMQPVPFSRDFVSTFWQDLTASSSHINWNHTNRNVLYAHVMKLCEQFCAHNHIARGHLLPKTTSVSENNVPNGSLMA